MADNATPVAPSAPTATTPAAPTDGALPPTPAPAPAHPEAISTEQAISAIEGETDMGKLASLLDTPAAPPPEPSSAVAPTPTPAPQPTPTDGATPPAAAPAPTPGEGEDDVIEETSGEKLPKNFRLHTENPQRSRFLKLLRQQPEANPIDLAKQVGYNLSAETAAAAPAPTPATDLLQPLRDEIAGLKSKKAELKAAYEFGQADDVNDQILEKTLELQRREDEVQEGQAFEEEYRGVYTEAREAALTKYPETATKGTPQFEEVQREVSFLERNEPGFFDDPNYPLELLVRLEKRRPDMFKGTTQVPPATPTPAVPPVQPVASPANARPPNAAARPVGEVVPGSAGAVQPLSKDEAVKAIGEMSIEELEKLGDQIGTKPKNAGKRAPGVIRGG